MQVNSPPVQKVQINQKNDVSRKVKMVALNQDGRQVTKHLGKKSFPLN